MSSTPINDEELITHIIKVIDPLCLIRYKEGDVLPRGHECDTANHMNEIQGFRERAARAKAARIVTIFHQWKNKP